MALTEKQLTFLEACSDVNLDLIKKLIISIEDVNFEQGGNSPLWHAVSNNNFELVHLLFEHGANVNFVDDINNSVLDGVDSVEMLELLISKGLNIHHRENEEESSLYFLGLYSNLKVFKKLIELGVKYQHLNFSSDWTERREEIQNYIICYEAKQEKEQLDNSIEPNNTYLHKQKI